MVIGNGTPGGADWTYQMNPLFMTLDEKKPYSGIGIGYYALHYGDPEKIFCFPKPAYEYIGYDFGEGNLVLSDASTEERYEARTKISTSSIITIFQYYKWAIYHKRGAITQGLDSYIIYINHNGEIRKASRSDLAGNVWRSTYRVKGLSKYKGQYGFGSSDVSTLTLANFGQTYNSEYNRVMFHGEDDSVGDDGYDKMVEYLRGSDPYPEGKDSATDPKDPYNPLINPSGPGGGGGTGRLVSLVDEPSLPTIDAIGTGFISLWNPTKSDLKALGAKLWSTDFFDSIVKNFQNPFDALLSLSIFPFTVSGVDGQEIIIGNYSTGVDSVKILRQYVSVDMGSCSVNEEVGSYLDYSPYTRLTLFLPYIGFVQLNTDEFMNGEISVKYHVDLLTGACVAYVFSNGYVHSQHTGNLSTQLPLSGRDAGSLYQSAINVGLSAIGTVASGGLTSALSAGALASSASTVMSSKDKVKIGGAVQGSAGFLGVQKPYIIIESPNLCVPLNQNAYTGYPTYMTVSLGSISGYTEVDSVHLEGIPCTEGELNEIETLLKGGVLL